MKLVNVVAAIIVNEQKQVLLARRHAQAHQGGAWEFPGGKIEKGESAQQALQREIKEELGLHLETVHLFHSQRHHYDAYTVNIKFFFVESYSGTAYGVEGQPISWVNFESINALELPAANHLVAEKLIDHLSAVVDSR